MQAPGLKGPTQHRPPCVCLLSLPGSVRRAAACSILVHTLRPQLPSASLPWSATSRRELLGAPLAALGSARLEGLWAGETWVSSDPYILAAAFQPSPAWHLVLTQPRALKPVCNVHTTGKRTGGCELHYWAERRLGAGKPGWTSLWFPLLQGWDLHGLEQLEDFLEGD